MPFSKQFNFVELQAFENDMKIYFWESELGMQVLKVSSNENKSVQSHVIPVTWEHWQFSSTRAVISAGLIAFFLTFSNYCIHTSSVWLIWYESYLVKKKFHTYFFDIMNWKRSWFWDDNGSFLDCASIPIK